MGMGTSVLQHLFILFGPSDLESANSSSSVNDLDCFENLKEFDYL